MKRKPFNLAAVIREVKAIEKLASKEETQHEAENAERDLEDLFVRWAMTADDIQLVRSVATEIAKCFDLDFPRNYSTEGAL